MLYRRLWSGCTTPRRSPPLGPRCWEPCAACLAGVRRRASCTPLGCWDGAGPCALCLFCRGLRKGCSHARVARGGLKAVCLAAVPVSCCRSASLPACTNLCLTGNPAPTPKAPADVPPFSPPARRCLVQPAMRRRRCRRAPPRDSCTRRLGGWGGAVVVVCFFPFLGRKGVFVVERGGLSLMEGLGGRQGAGCQRRRCDYCCGRRERPTAAASCECVLPLASSPFPRWRRLRP
jgi:hypothetical protein